MLLKEYIKAITYLFAKGDNTAALIPLSIIGLGLSGEMAEAVEACDPYMEAYQKSGPSYLKLSAEKSADLKKAEHDLLLEYGDVLWYVAALCYRLGFDIQNLDKPLAPGNKPNAFVTIGRINDMLKKADWHGKEIDSFTMQVQVMTLLGILRRDAQTLGYALEDVAKMNVDKVKRRYPGGFVEGGGIRS